MAGGRSQSDKEKTKMRERQRRAITTNIFNGLRKHGGYPLSPRADINEVLRHLALEAGWIVLPDGTTYRSISNFMKCCPVCGTATASATPTPRSSVVIGGGAGGGVCSRTASPEGFAVEGHSVTARPASGGFLRSMPPAEVRHPTKMPMPPGHGLSIRMEEDSIVYSETIPRYLHQRISSSIYRRQGPPTTTLPLLL